MKHEHTPSSHNVATAGAIDPVCGMTVDPATAKHMAEHKGHTFLKERPAGAIALVVPGMPMESPGMEMGGASEAFDVLMISTNSAPTVYARH